jgi:carbon-monoxide dehydrogenase medium subunit
LQEIVYHAPRSVAELCQILADHPGAKVLAGGTDLVAQLREGRRAAGHIVDAKRSPELIGIERRPDGGWRIGAAVTVGALGRHPEFAAAHPALLAAARLIGGLQIQNRASLGGNLCNAAPSADAVPILVCMGAMAEICGATGRRRVPVEEIGTAPGRTSLAPGEVLVALELPPPRPRTASAYLRFTPRREMDIAVAGVAAEISLATDGRITDARIALASVAPTVMLARSASHVLSGARPDVHCLREAARAAAREARPISDARATADYRRALVETLTQRVLAKLVDRIGAQP